MASTGSDATTPRPGNGWVGGWVGADPVRAAGIALLLISLVWRAQLASRGYLAVDDYVLIARAAESDLTPGHLLTLYNNHFMPAALLVTWLVTRAAGLAYWPYVLLLTAAQAVLAVAFFRLLRSLVRPGWAQLVPLAVFLFSPLTLEATSWWAVGVNMLPMQIAMVLAVGAQLRYVRTGRRRHLFTLALAVVFGLLFFEKSLLVVPLVFLLTAFLFVGGPPGRAVLVTIGRYWPSWAVLTTISLGFLGLYLSRAESSLRKPDSLGEVLSFLWQLLGSTVVPGLLGGPWRWLPAGDGAPVTAPPELARWLAWAVFLALVVVTVRLRRVAGRAWLLLAAYLVLVTAMLAATRLGSIYSDVAGAVPRYVSDVVVVGALCIGVAMLGIAPATTRTGRSGTRADSAAVQSGVVDGERSADPPASLSGPTEADVSVQPAGPPDADGPTDADGDGPTDADGPTAADEVAVVPAAYGRTGVIHEEAGDDEWQSRSPARQDAGPSDPAPEGPGAAAVATTSSDAARDTGEDPATDTRYPVLPARHRETVSTGLALALLAAGLGTAWTIARYGDEWSVKAGRIYLDTVRSELAAAPPGTVFFDQPVPGEVVPALSAPYNRQSKFFAALPEGPTFVTESEAPSVFDDSGRIVPVRVDGPAVLPGPEDGCGYKVKGGQTVRMPLSGPRDDWFWVVRIGYLSSADTIATFRLGDGERTFPVRQGLHQIFFEFTGGGETAELTLEGHGVTLCTNEVAIGTPAPQQ